MFRQLPIPWRLRLQFVTILAVLGLLLWQQFSQTPVNAQVADPSAATSTAVAPEGTASEPAAPPVEDKSLRLLTLYFKGGAFMIPLTLLGILSLTMIIERSMGIRRSKVIPEGLVTSLGQLGTASGGFDPRRAFRICQQYPSAASSVIRTMLLKIGRPMSEVEHSVVESSEKEATRLYANVRWINIVTAVAPLLGLLGTVWGMILAFHQMTQLAPGQDKVLVLSTGIYTALVTTLAGLCVAIPSALASHWFEGRIQNMFHEVDDLVFNLLPQVEKYENRVRFSKQHAEEEPVDAAVASKSS